jgi:cobalt-zinc-cadmium resistance protein CzcA
MKEGSVVPGINRVPNISLEESIKMEMEAMRLVMQVPGVKSAVSGVGRGESPADPQGPNESTPIVSLKPRSEWPSGWTQDDIQDAMRDKLKGLPGVQVVMAQPISDRVDEMVTGVRSDIAVKVFGDDLDQLKKVAGQIGKVAQSLQGAQDLRIERISGQQYLSIEIDRQAIARLGLNVAMSTTCWKRRSAARWRPRFSRASAASPAWFACPSISATTSRRFPMC